jgi:hypothetical protein
MLPFALSQTSVWCREMDGRMFFFFIGVDGSYLSPRRGAC